MIQSFRILSASVSDRGLNERRPHNEDAFLEIPQNGIFAVADGVGGAQAGEVASQMAVEILGEAFVNLDERQDAEDVMRTALMRANSAINQMSNELPQLSQMATTVVALHLAGNIATIGHAGDSRMYRLDADGRLYRETADHSMVAEEVRAGRMTEEQAENHPSKNIISRALGAEPTIEIEMRTIMVGENNVFFLCSDGVTRHISDLEIGDLLRSGGSPQAICERVKELCLARGAEDNFTAVVVNLGAAERSVQTEVASHSAFGEDEITVSTARGPVALNSDDEHEDDDLLELETSRLTMPSAVSDEADIFQVIDIPTPKIDDPVAVRLEQHSEEPSESSPLADEEVCDTFASVHNDYDVLTDETPVVESGSAVTSDGPDEFETAAAITLPEPIAPAVTSEPIAPEKEPDFEIFGSTNNEADVTKAGSGTVGRMIRSVALLVVGSVFGLAGYHFFLADRLQPQPVQQPLTEMKSNSQPQSSFEENRRTLDKAPEAALAQYEKEEKDAENRFLVGRAYMLLGKYPEARKAFVESLERIAAGDVDAGNAKTLQTDIAIDMTILNDPAAQVNLTKELSDPKVKGSPAPGSKGNTNGNANMAGPQSGKPSKNANG